MYKMDNPHTDNGEYTVFCFSLFRLLLLKRVPSPVLINVSLKLSLPGIYIPWVLNCQGFIEC
jgi:hypothetical protein